MRFFLLFLLIILLSCSQERHKKPLILPDNIKQYYKKQLIDYNKYLIKEYTQRIKEYIKRKEWEMQISPTGLFYMIYEHGWGKQAEKGDIATIKYKISLLDGTLCYTSDSLGLKTFEIGHGGVEAGLEEGILLLAQGDKARFIMPPYLAHGFLGDNNKIPPDAIIIYELELVKLIKHE